MKIIKHEAGPIGTNMYICYDENNVGFIVDPGEYNNSLSQRIKSLNLDIKYIILTHGHADHIGGVNGFVLDYPEAKIIAHELAEEMLLSSEQNGSTEMYGYPIVVEADSFVKDGDELKCGELEMKFLHTPGHTIGDMGILLDGVLFSGDTIFANSVGRTDFPGGSFETIIESIKTKIYTLDENTVIYPGHMGLTTVKDEKRGNPFVRA